MNQSKLAVNSRSERKAGKGGGGGDGRGWQRAENECEQVVIGFGSYFWLDGKIAWVFGANCVAWLGLVMQLTSYWNSTLEWNPLNYFD